jgi:transposase
MGMRALSTDLRERIVRAVANGQPKQEAARRFGVSLASVKRYVTQQEQTGTICELTGRTASVERR